MPDAFPFRRLFVDHLIEGGTRVWWELLPTFRDGGPLRFQLQAGKTGLPTATDWVDVGDPVADGFMAVDDEKRLYGKQLETHYRVQLTDSTGQRYLSNPVSVDGLLDEHNWLIAQEIIRKFALLDQFVSAEGWLLKRRRYGPRCTRCLDTLTGEITNSKCLLCRGTGYLVGYHPPVRLCLKLEPQAIRELRNGAQVPGQTQYNMVTAHVQAFPQLALEDIWVMDHSDMRFALDQIAITSSMKGVPLLSDVTMHQLPFTDIAYRIQVGGETDDNPREELPAAGAGSVRVTHDYMGEDLLAYQLADGCGVEGATLYFFRKADFTAGLRSPAAALASTTTMANGRWAFAVNLDPGDYIILAEKPGEYGPDIIELIVREAAAPASSSSISAAPAGFAREFGAF